VYIHWSVYIGGMARSSDTTRERIISAASKLFYDQGIRAVSVDAVSVGVESQPGSAVTLCDSSVPGNCGCIHSEMNALVKAPGNVRDKVVFVSASPCVMCAKMAINANVGRVYYREAYRDPAGLDTLRQGGVEVIHYNRWRDLWR